MPRIYDYRTGYFHNQHVFDECVEGEIRLALTVIGDKTVVVHWGYVGGKLMWIVPA